MLIFTNRGLLLILFRELMRLHMDGTVTDFHDFASLLLSFGYEEYFFIAISNRDLLEEVVRYLDDCKLRKQIGSAAKINDNES